MIKAFAVIGILSLGFFVGWVAAHSAVASECKKLGAFFVGKETYHCYQVGTRENEE